MPRISPSRTGAKLSVGKNAGIVALLFVAMVMGLFFVNVVKENLGLEERHVDFGATFSKPYAESLGLDWKQAYIATLDDLGVRRLRIPAYWNDIEPEPEVFNFASVDWQIAEAAKRNAKVILTVGRKAPRWPECHDPVWAEGMSEPLVQTRILEMVEQTVRHFRDDPTIVMWQVENEPFFQFGECPPPDRDFLAREVAVVRALDTRPIVITESGELSSWVSAAGVADVVGVSTYRSVWDKYIGYFYWPISPKTYVRRSNAISPLVDGVIISELQAEPWAPDGYDAMPIDEQLRLMNPTRLNENIQFSRKVGFPDAYLWGVEWWYWMKEKKNRPELWDTARQIFRTDVTAPR